MKTTNLGESWEFQAPDNQWHPAVVPGCIHTDLLAQNLIEDPFVKQNESKSQWVDERDWCYRCRFTWNPSDSLPHRRLRFEGLDTVCTVLLNGQVLAVSDNMFMPLELDVAESLRPGENELRIDFQSAARVGRERKAAYFAEQGLAEDTPNFDERAFVRKAQYMFGWDWGPRLVSCGIWKPVWLLEAEGISNRSNESNRSNSSHQVKLLQIPDKFGTSFEFDLNGRRLYALGANWIPDHSFPSLVTPDRLRKRLQQAKDMGMNMLRVWGGGIYESDEFYDICDELGILVWQDFMFACSYYPDTAEWQETVRREAECHVLRLRHHPCIALWCGNNECHQVWQDCWGGKDKQPSRFHGEVLYHEVLADVVQRLDKERAYVPGSPFGGAYCNQGGIGDQHFWDVWHGRGDWTFYSDSTARFCSEFGFMSSPSEATWARAGVEAAVPVEDPDARWHNKTGKPFEIIKGLVELHHPEAANLDEWVYYTQLNQRDAMRAALEHFRFSEFCRGALIWQLNDCWPVESWSLLEFDGRKKAAAYECSRLFAPLLLRLDVEGAEAKLQACLHNSDAGFQGRAKLEAFSLTSEQKLFSEEAQVKLEPDQINPVLGALVKAEELVVWVGSLGDKDGGVQPSHVRQADGYSLIEGLRQTFKTYAKPSGINEEPRIRARTVGNTVELTSDQIALDIFLEDIDNPLNTFEPNFFSLLAGGSIVVQASAPVGRIRMRCLKFD